VAARAGRDGAVEGLVIFAEKQRAGRGRLGRRWSSPPRQGLWFSVLLRPQVPITRWPELTFCAALAVAEAAEVLTGARAAIKWPNDVLIGGRKIAGILLECHHTDTQGFVVMGIGVNVLQQEGNFEPELRASAGSLVMAARGPVDRRAAAATILQRLDYHYANWPINYRSITELCEQRRSLTGTVDDNKERGGHRTHAAPLSKAIRS
jgi:BirA family biotin operon repressor/biotin-[acetyl-CoA-carboxylase] ligase